MLEAEGRAREGTLYTLSKIVRGLLLPEARASPRPLAHSQLVHARNAYMSARTRSFIAVHGGRNHRRS